MLTSFRIRSEIGAMFLAASVAMLAGAATCQAVDLGNLVLIGDSITQAAANGDHQGYRYPLWQKLIDGGHTFDYVGSLDNNFFEPNGGNTTSYSTYPDYQGNSFDSDHEGHWGWRTTDLLGTTTPQFGAGSGTGNLSTWLAGYTPDTAVLLIGVNDIKYAVGASVANTANNVRSIISALKADNPSVSIYLAGVLPSSTGFADGTKIQQLNAEYQQIADADASVTYVDTYSAINVSAHLYDGIHPNSIGEQILATKLFSAITGSSPPPQPLGVTNPSFELPSVGAGGAATSISGWVEAGPGGDGSQGVVANGWRVGGVPNAQVNVPNSDGTQVGWMNTEVNTSVSQIFVDQFVPGLAYDLTIGLGRAQWNPPNDDDQLQVQLYYEHEGAAVVVASATATAADLNDSLGALTDFTASLETVGLSDDWAGRPIGVRIISTVEGANGGNGDWIFDNVRFNFSLLEGDYNLDGVVNLADYTVWRDSLGATGLAAYSGADGNGDGSIDAADYQVWKSNFGPSAAEASVTSPVVAANVPEPTSWCMLAMLFLSSSWCCPRSGAVLHR